ncbi:DNA-binding helix-turn-helix protein [Peptoniphilus duerdenii ATCC BAA-1640]|uniref:DNA-binding helix-turn-helix protein n=2 Tax=Peptoniphilus TaxID=162289 RepID=E0NND6_9FIRM|nr:DNA-binding helix-turn-helix protein [Peptoniphilus duerdenii ATCC BAA-1640]
MNEAIRMISNLGSNIKYLREKNNLSQKELAKILNISNSTLSQYESNVRVPSDDIKILIADYFNVSLDYLLGRSSNPHKNNKKTKVDELEEDFPEGISVLYRANQKLTPEQKDTMIRMIKATFFDDEDDNKSK